MKVCANGKTPTEVATAWMEAAARCDLDTIAAGMADDCKRYGEPNWMIIEKADYVASYAQYLKSFSDYRLEILNTVASGDTVVFEMIETATLSGPYSLPDGTVVPPNGQSYTDHVCTWIKVNDSGTIAEIRAYIPSNRGALIANAMNAAI